MRRRILVHQAAHLHSGSPDLHQLTWAKPTARLERSVIKYSNPRRTHLVHANAATIYELSG